MVLLTHQDTSSSETESDPGKEKVVLRGKKKAMRAVSRLLGVESVSINSDYQKFTAINAILVAKTRKLLETVSSVYQLMQRMDTSAQAGASSTSLFPLPTQSCEPVPLYSAQVSSMNSTGQETAQILEQLQYEELIDSTRSFPPVMLAQDRDNDVIVDRKRLLNEKEMSIKNIEDMEELLAARKALLTAERVVLEELIAKDEQIEELIRALEVEKMKNADLASLKENDYLMGVANCRLKILDRYPELDLSWMEDYAWKDKRSSCHREA
ncbi:hypothetical protein QYF36_017686 [Acer negundo]|nr:hypothetical protein QYF36_017686 [Acer negundo]